ncbi:VanZ family protein [Winogradskyella aurantiaca]|uniref:VanZ family protein n=1 Tax=Winogradskyella aurantiaca TaxID=2219558 RepID=UPI0013002F6D|nr:VanZ family protein [Winogradskyella aurantiaca]
MLIAAIGYSVFITVINFINLESIPQVGLGFEDKIYHVGAYMVFSFLWGAWSRLKYPIIALKSVFIVCLLYGVFLEAIQHLINSSRTFDALDLAANCCGVLFGIVIVRFLSKKKVKLN